jgi:acetyltransferase-like isoleucine patch superfamily enzyme
MLFPRLKQKLLLRLGKLIRKAENEVAKSGLPKFGNRPINVVIESPRRIVNPHKMFLGNDICFGPGSFLIALTCYPSKTMQHPERKDIAQTFDPRIEIGNRVTATGDLQIAATRSVVIENDVIFAKNIYITDQSHGYANANEPYKYQKLQRISPVLIKQGCWIGQNVVILPGVTIGEFAIIGANSVVTKSVPDRCIAVGAPAKVIKEWNKDIEEWISIENL